MAAGYMDLFINSDDDSVITRLLLLLLLLGFFNLHFLSMGQEFKNTESILFLLTSLEQKRAKTLILITSSSSFCA